MQDSPALICLTSRCRTCLPLTCLHHLSPDKLTSLPSLTTTSASAFLVPVCSPGPDRSNWPQIRCCSSPVCSATYSASCPVRPSLSLLPVRFRGFTSSPSAPHSGSARTQSLSPTPIDFAWALSLKNGLFPVFPCLPEFLLACVLIKGLGYASQVIILHGCVYYIVILAWALFYLVYSFQAELPWSHCNNTWNTGTCILFNHQNQTVNGSLPENATSPVMEFWEREVLNLSDNLDKLGPINWKLALCLAAIWVICYFCVWKGVKSTGKVVYLTATFPYVMLLVLLVRGITLPGAGRGIIYYLKPDIGRLADPEVWMDAGTQIFFSYGICLGSLTALGSYNKYNNNCYKDSFLLCLLNSSTSFLAGFAIFSVLGFMAEEQGMDVSNVAQSGPGLAFIAFPRAVSMMPVPQLWAVCFFIMIIMLGLDTQFVSLEALMTSVTDLYPHLIRRGRRRELLLLFVCSVCFLAGLVMVTPGGIYVFQIYDHYSCSGASLLLLAIFQSVAVGWIYGAERFRANIRHMTGKKPLFIFKLCWKYLTPAVCTATFLFSLVNWSPLSLVRGLVAPAWATALGLVLTFSSVSLIPIWAIYAFSVTPGTLAQRFKQLCSPAQDLPAANPPTMYIPVLPLTEKAKEGDADLMQNRLTV
ncbi:Sodium- and chloride-dependent GABA transporter 2 [Takifugu flavidus]|uniref:Sodium-and chloride-dependent GABA transporter 2 n=1 Tax=Takifugu flavidus TaxID=433684 RepID=A0A5C6N9K6_9TELE|nr:Sodium- and chloride-dependent GABA transporter 2 [Takifugu flavidus]